MDEFRAAQLVPLPRDEAARQARGDSHYSVEGDRGEKLSIENSVFDQFSPSNLFCSLESLVERC